MTILYLFHKQLLLLGLSLIQLRYECCGKSGLVHRKFCHLQSVGLNPSLACVLAKKYFPRLLF